MKFVNLDHVREAVSESCTCGGGDPGLGCPACEAWHRIRTSRHIELDHKTLRELEERAQARPRSAGGLTNG